MNTAAEKKVGVVCLFGEANAGKSSLLNKIIGKKVSITTYKPQTTRNSIRGIFNDEGSQIVFVDTPGVYRAMHRGAMTSFMRHEIRDSVSTSDIPVLVLDAQKIMTSRSAVESIKTTLKEALGGGEVPEIVVINKIDLIDQRQLLPIIALLTSEMFPAEKTDCIPVSARTGEGVAEFVKALQSRMEIGPLMFEDDIYSEESDETFYAEIVREKAFLLLKEELPYRLGVVCRGQEESDSMLSIFMDILVEKSSQKAIVIGKGGEMLKTIGTNARVELEKIFGTKVCLKLHVKVEEKWTESDEGLRKLGYQRALRL